MIHERRTNRRRAVAQLGGILVKVESEEGAWHGRLANICHEGLCVGLAAAAEQAPGRGSQVSGWLHGAGVAEPIHFSGSLMWSAERSDADGRQTLLGVHFGKQCELPADLLEPEPA